MEDVPLHTYTLELEQQLLSFSLLGVHVRYLMTGLYNFKKVKSIGLSI